MKARRTGETYKPNVKVLKANANIPTRISINGIQYALMNTQENMKVVAEKRKEKRDKGAMRCN